MSYSIAIQGRHKDVIQGTDHAKIRYLQPLFAWCHRVIFIFAGSQIFAIATFNPVSCMVTRLVNFSLQTKRFAMFETAPRYFFV